MRDLLSRDCTGLLAQMAGARVLLGFDFDGTLAPIVGERDEAQMRSRTAALFAKVCGLYPCAVISGRSQADVRARLAGAGVRFVVGNHGLEPGAGLGDLAHEIARAKGLLQRALVACQGVDIEDKRYSLAVHYRKSRQKRQARAAVHQAIEDLPLPMRSVAGKLVINVLPAGAPNKGDALLRLRTSQHADTALYVGDDVTDEDVFRVDQPGRLLTVRIGHSRTSAATYFLRAQKDIDRLLGRLVALRASR